VGALLLPVPRVVDEVLAALRAMCVFIAAAAAAVAVVVLGSSLEFIIS